MAKRKRKSEPIRVEADTMKRLREYVEKNRIELMFFATKAIDEKLDRELVKETQ